MVNKENLTAIYCRLSSEDGLDNISVSIENQINICKQFLNDNNLYKARISEFFPSFKLERLIEEILWGYVAFITPHINSYSGADVFLDKRSVCYSKFSVIDFL